MAGESKTTTNHDEIRHWVAVRGGRPAAVKETSSNGDPGILRIDYPGRAEDDALEPISWNEFFEAFEGNNLAFLYQEETKEGEESRFSRFVRRAS
jgi:hypothetical protein